MSRGEVAGDRAGTRATAAFQQIHHLSDSEPDTGTSRYNRLDCCSNVEQVYFTD